VFHSSEIDAVERRYVPGEQGVKLFEPVHYSPHNWEGRGSLPPSYGDSLDSHQNYPTHLPESEPAHEVRETVRTSFLAPSTRHQRPQRQHQPFDSKEHPLPRRLHAGDVVYWHNLTRGGEARGVQDNYRARQLPCAVGSPEAGHSFGIAFDR